MAIVVDVDVMLARRKLSVGELAERVGITPANLAVLKNGRAKAVRFTTLAALCEALQCQPGDLLRWEADEPPDSGRVEARDLLGGQLEVRGRGGVGDRARPLGARDRDDAGRLGELPREGDLLRAHAVRLGDLAKAPVLVAELLGRREPAERTPRQEGEPELLGRRRSRGGCCGTRGRTGSARSPTRRPAPTCPVRICSGFALLRPTISTLPESAISLSVPITSA
jgi:putative transcriptional regulator